MQGKERKKSEWEGNLGSEGRAIKKKEGVKEILRMFGRAIRNIFFYKLSFLEMHIILVSANVCVCVSMCI